MTEFLVVPGARGPVLVGSPPETDAAQAWPTLDALELLVLVSGEHGALFERARKLFGDAP